MREFSNKKESESMREGFSIRTNFPVFMKLLVIFLVFGFFPFVIASVFFLWKYGITFKSFETMILNENPKEALSRIADMRHTLRIQMGFLVIFFSLFMLIGVMFGTKILINPLIKLLAGIRKLAKGKYGTKIKIESSDEFAIFSDYFNQMSEQLDTAHKRERLIAQMKSSVLAIAAHQLRTPITAVFWALEGLSVGDYGILGKDQQEAIQKSLISIRRMLRLISSLLDVAKIEEGHFGYTFQSTDIKKIILESIAEFQDLAKKKNIILRLKIPDTTPGVYINSEKIKIALGNLLSNAINYSYPGGEVMVSVSTEIVGKKGERVSVSVEDKGIGMSEDEVGRLFARFFRVPEAIEMNMEGSGLGLFITKNIIRRHGGDILVKSERGKGSVFSFTIPVAKEQIPKEEFSEPFILGP